MIKKLQTKYGPWAVVTGASEGIGKEFAFRLAEAGINTVLVARRADLLAALANDLETKHSVITQQVIIT